MNYGRRFTGVDKLFTRRMRSLTNRDPYSWKSIPMMEHYLERIRKTALTIILLRVSGMPEILDMVVYGVLLHLRDSIATYTTLAELTCE